MILIQIIIREENIEMCHDKHIKKHLKTEMLHKIVYTFEYAVIETAKKIISNIEQGM